MTIYLQTIGSIFAAIEVGAPNVIADGRGGE